MIAEIESLEFSISNDRVTLEYVSDRPGPYALSVFEIQDGGHTPSLGFERPKDPGDEDVTRLISSCNFSLQKVKSLQSASLVACFYFISPKRHSRKIRLVP